MALLLINKNSSSSVELTIRPTSYPTPPAFAAATNTAVIFDERVLTHKIPSGDHPERPERCLAVRDALLNNGLLAHCTNSVPRRLVTRAEVELVHEIKHWDKMEWAISQEISALQAWANQQESLYLCGSSLDAARAAAGSVVELTREVMTGRARNGMALVRPPGHHAEAHAAMGFCVLNTCAIAAQYAREHLGCQRVLIVDWDIHHGNGIQHIFEDDPSVLYFSVHRYERGQFFPENTIVPSIGSDGGPQSAGTGNGTGTSVNIGWNTKGGQKPGDAEYLAAWSDVLMPVGREFAPDLVIVAAGFDAAEGDPLGGCHVTPECYTALTRDLMSLAGGKIVLALEGGYSLAATSVSAAACMEALLGLAAPEPEKLLQPAFELQSPRKVMRRGNNPFARFRQKENESAKEHLERQPSAGTPGPPKDPCDRGARKAIDETRQVHAEYWKCMKNSLDEKPPAAMTPRRSVSSAKKAAEPPPPPPPPPLMMTDPADELAAAVANLGLGGGGGGGGGIFDGIDGDEPMPMAATPTAATPTAATPTRAAAAVTPLEETPTQPLRRSARKSIAPSGLTPGLTPFAAARATGLPPPPKTPTFW